MTHCPECGSKDYLPVKKLLYIDDKEEDNKYKLEVIFACTFSNCKTLWKETWEFQEIKNSGGVLDEV